jgi:hypothetical protein
MRLKTVLTLSGAVLWLAACAETTGPPPARPPEFAQRVLHPLRWDASTAPRAFGVVAAPSRPQMVAQSAASAAGIQTLDRYQLAFWAYADRSQSVEIRYRAADGSWLPYLSFSVPRGSLARRPDGQAVLPGDSVLITLSIDTTTLVVTLEPTGLTFDSERPAQLSIWYTGADPDYDGNGVVDGTDGYIEQTLLGLWVRERNSDPWTGVLAVHALSQKQFVADLLHFSGYALSW